MERGGCSQASRARDCNSLLCSFYFKRQGFFMTSLSASKLPSVTPRSTTQNSMINEAALTKLVQKYVFARDEEFRRHQNIGTGTGDKQSRGLPYHLVLPAKSGLSPEDIFANLRWGGRAILVSES